MPGFLEAPAFEQQVERLGGSLLRQLHTRTRDEREHTDQGAGVPTWRPAARS
jgi:hypothetical protein